MVFYGRLLLKVISSVLLLLMLSIAIACLLNTQGTPKEILGFGALMFGTPCVILGSWMNTVFGYIRVDDQGILRKTLLGKKLIPWTTISGIKIWKQTERAQHGSSIETYVLIRGENAKKLMLLKSSYDDAAYPYIFNEARKRNLLEPNN